MKLKPGLTYYDMWIDITGLTLRGIDFDGCILECRLGLRTEIVDCSFRDCRLIGNAWPADLRELSK